MKLQKFSKSSTKRKKIVIACSIVVCLLIAGFAIFKTYALYEENKTYDALQGQIPAFRNNIVGNVKLAANIDGTSSTTFPSATDGYWAGSVSCTNGALGSWDIDSWSLVVKNLTSSTTTCTVTFKSNYIEQILNGADPVLTGKLIAVKIADDGTVTAANTRQRWFSYEDLEWANAVITVSGNTYAAGTTIPESDIESYFVWIPRYKYKIWDLGTYTSLTSINTSQRHTIDVVFGTDTTSDSNDGECTTPGTSGATGNCGIGDYMTHPAFTSFNVNGLWVGKFESGYKGATSTGGAQVNSNDSSKLQIKPNVYSWRAIQVSNAHLTSYNYQRELDSHMMKNTEWGAVAYLQHSAYGSQKSVRINNNSAYLTGYAGVNEPTTGYTGTNISCSTTPDGCNEYGTSTSITKAYNTETGYLASTTGNITGVYDMSGGAWEYMMGILADSSGNPMSGRNKSYNSGFLGTYGCPTCDSNDGTASNTTGKSWPDKKYYDLYTYQTSASSYKNRILGDATGELGPFQSMTYGSQTRQINSWYDDEGWFVYPSTPWFIRGGDCYIGTGAGVFDFGYANGPAGSFSSFRVVLAV